MYYGDIRLGDTIDFKFTTVDSTGLPTTLAGTPVVAAYPSNSTTESTTGVTLTVDLDARTGLHNVRVVATSGNGYATTTNYAMVLTAGTVSGVSVVGYHVGSFSIENRSALMPTIAGRTLAVSNTGVGDANTTQIAGSTVNTNSAQIGVNVVNVANQSQSGGDIVARIGVPTGVSLSADVAAVQADTDNLQTRIPAALVSGRIDASVGAMAANVVTATSIAADAITDAKVASDVTIASVTGAVGSVTAGVTVTTNSDKTGYALTSGERTSIAEALLKLDLSTVTGEAARSVLNAVRFLRNKWSISGTTLTVTKEDDTTSAWTSALTTSAVAEPITASDPT